MLFVSRLFAGLVALGSAACDPPTAPPFEASIAAAPLNGPAPEPVVTRLADTVRVSWWIGTNEPCYEFGAAAEASQDTLVVTVVASRLDGFCIQVLAAFAYTVTVTGVGPTLNALRLIYDRHGPPTFVETVLEAALRQQ